MRHLMHRAASCASRRGGGAAADRAPHLSAAARAQRRIAVDARSGRRHGDAQRRARASTCPRRSTTIDARRDPRRPAAGQPVETLLRVPGHRRRRTARTTRRTCRSPRAASARARPSACAACGSTRTASRRRCPTAGPDRQLQPAVGAAHRSAARAVLDALRQRVRRRDRGVHRGSGAPIRRRARAAAAAATAACNVIGARLSGARGGVG